MGLSSVAVCLCLLAGTAVASIDVGRLGMLAVVPLAVVAGVCGAGRLARDQALGVVTASALVLAGFGLTSAADERACRPSIRDALTTVIGGESTADAPRDIVWLDGVLQADVAPGVDGARVDLRVSRMSTERGSVDTDGRVWLTVAGAVWPDGGDIWWRGRTVRVPALLRRPARYLDPGVPDFDLALLRRGVSLVGTIKSPLLIDIRARGGFGAEAAGRVRAYVRRRVRETFATYDTRTAAIVLAILIGDRAGLDAETEERLQRAGTYHVLAISGGNIAILAALVFGLVRICCLPPPWRELTAMVAIGSYGWLVGPDASVIRAVLVAELVLLGRLWDLRGTALSILATAGVINLLCVPLLLFDAGTWLTYGASLAILLALEPLLARTARWPAVARAVGGMVALSVAVEIVLMPIGAAWFNRVTLAGPVVNLVAIPLMSGVQVGALIVLTVGECSTAAAGELARVVHWCAWGLVESGRLVDVAPWLSWRLAPPGPWALAVYYGAVAGLVGWARHRGWRAAGVWCGRWPRVAANGTRVCAAVASGAGLWILTAPACVWPDGEPSVRVTFIDVGQGDAALVECPGGSTVLIDAGGDGGGRFDVGGRVVAPVLWSRGVRRLSALALTHGDVDHIGGAGRMVTDFRPREVWEGVPVPPHQPLRDVRVLAEISGAWWRRVQTGDRLMAGGAEILVHHPPPEDWERQRVRNDDSVVVEVRFGGASVILPGDLEAMGELSVLRTLSPATVRVVQLPHHGSATSSSDAFLQGTAPAAVVVSVGRHNRYGHPHPAVLQRVGATGARVWRTDQDGAITVRLTPRGVRLSGLTGRQDWLPAVPVAARENPVLLP